MAIPKKGSRKIVVNNITYRWLVRKKPSYDQECFATNLLAAVELFEKPSSTLSIEFPNVRFDCLVASNKETKVVSPKIIESCIVDAIKKGWKPDKRGSTFEYFYNILD